MYKKNQNLSKNKNYQTLILLKQNLKNKNF